MIRNPLALRLDSEHSIRDQIQDAARLGARGVVLEASGDLAPHRLGETARRDLRHVLRTVELALPAVVLPTRRPFDSLDQLDDRMRRADAVFALAYELGARTVLVRAGAAPAVEDPRREVFLSTLHELERRADHRGVVLALETGGEPIEPLNQILIDLGSQLLKVSLDPAGLLYVGVDPIAAVSLLAERLAHAYADDAVGRPGAIARHPRGVGFPSGALDWEEYAGALEEVGYHGFLTFRGDSARPIGPQFQTLLARLKTI